MSVGIVMLAHTALDRAAQVARHWAEQDCPVVIHVDRKVPASDYETFCTALSDLENVRFSARIRCDWGRFGIVRATQIAAMQILDAFPDIRHVYLTSGSCLPLRPAAELINYLDQRPTTDFIESVTTEDVRWTTGGLDVERFTLRFPFSWKRQRWLFDRYVRLQRLVRFNRKIPPELEPHMGSQWWCLTRRTLSAILQDPSRTRHDRYFRRAWIPDESYFQTLARRYSEKIESRSLTLSKFDFQGHPHVFYDDHLNLLRRSDCFVARKIWPLADRLYETFLSTSPRPNSWAEPNPATIDRVFSRAVTRRVHGRAGLFMQGRFPHSTWDSNLTATPYTVFEGFSDLFENFEDWASRNMDARVHGHIFAPDQAEFSDRQPVQPGSLSSSACLRDYNPRAFLSNLIWNAQGDHQCFQFGPRDNQDISWDLTIDPNANVYVISGAWALPLFRQNANFADLRKEAARLQKIEARHLDKLKATCQRARVRIWTLAEFIEAPGEHLLSILNEIAPRNRQSVTELPRLPDLDGFAQFLQNLRNQGMHPYLVGNFPVNSLVHVSPVQTRKSLSAPNT